MAKTPSIDVKIGLTDEARELLERSADKLLEQAAEDGDLVTIDDHEQMGLFSINPSDIAYTETFAPRQTTTEGKWHTGNVVTHPPLRRSRPIDRIIRRVASTPWAMEPGRLMDFLDALSYRHSGAILSEEEIREYCGVDGLADDNRAFLVSDDWEPGQTAPLLAAEPSGNARKAGAVAVIRIRGIIAHHIEQVQRISGPGGTSVEGIQRNFRAALANSEVGSILFDIDSPGGAIEGIEEVAEEIRDARGEKPILAIANAQAASAAFWIATAADKVSITPSGQAGAIGVFAAHEDISAALEAEGRSVTLVHAGKFKVEGNPFEPLGEDARVFLQSRVDEVFTTFVDAVAKGRGTSLKKVREGFGQGRQLGAEAAFAEGMVDRIETFDQTLSALRLGRKRPQRNSRAALELRRRALSFH